MRDLIRKTLTLLATTYVVFVVVQTLLLNIADERLSTGVSIFIGVAMAMIFIRYWPDDESKKEDRNG